MSFDLLFVKALLQNNELTGFYAAASTIARTPYLLMWALTAALFPALSASTHNLEKIQSYIRESLRYSLIILLPTAAMVAATPVALVSLFFSNRYASAGPSLQILIIGLSIFGIFALLTTIMSGCNRPGVAMAISLFILIIDIGLNFILVSVYGLTGAAIATSITSILGVCIAATYIHKQYGILISIIPVLKILCSAVLIFFILYLLAPQGLWLIPAYTGALIVYTFSLYTFGEINYRDIERLKRIIS